MPLRTPSRSGLFLLYSIPLVLISTQYIFRMPTIMGHGFTFPPAPTDQFINVGLSPIIPHEGNSSRSWLPSPIPVISSYQQPLDTRQTEGRHTPLLWSHHSKYSAAFQATLWQSQLIIYTFCWDETILSSQHSFTSFRKTNQKYLKLSMEVTA